MDDLIAWLRAVLDEDWNRVQSEIDEMGFGDLTPSTDDLWHLADIEAKRAVLDEHTATVGPACPTCAVHVGGSEVASVRAPCRTVRLLASAYRHRDGYRDEWRPQ